MRGALHRMVADNTSPSSLATRLRRRRFQFLRDFLADGSNTVSILDIGGRAEYWDMMLDDHDLKDRLKITVLNVDVVAGQSPYETVTGDARSLPQFGDGEFDLVFSNSTIEHVGGWSDQMRMAAEVRRVGRRYYVQTPNKYFFVEPHFVFPMFHLLPIEVRAALVRRFALGWMPRQPELGDAVGSVNSIRLLTRTEMKCLFPDGTFANERLAGMTKSLIAYRV